MTTKGRLLELLESSRGEYLSGAAIAEKLCVTRTSVWKAAKSLRKEGYAISAVTNRGYMLKDDTDVLSAEGVNSYRKGGFSGADIEVYKCVGSTNALLRERAEAGAPEGTVILAAEQTAGRGRKGRSFFSPHDTGLYLSLLLRPDLPAERAVLITTAAAVAVCEAIEAVTGIPAGIKWVNDIFAGGKKVCGILTEASFSMESGGLSYAILGVGINVYEPEGGFPDELRDIAGALLKMRRADARCRIAAEFLDRFFEIYRKLDSAEYVEEYRKRSIALGRRVSVLSPDGVKSAEAIDVDDECRLIVRYEDGTVSALSSGEISIKL